MRVGKDGVHETGKTNLAGNRGTGPTPAGSDLDRGSRVSVRLNRLPRIAALCMVHKGGTVSVLTRSEEEMKRDDWGDLSCSRKTKPATKQRASPSFSLFSRGVGLEKGLQD